MSNTGMHGFSVHKKPEFLRWSPDYPPVSGSSYDDEFSKSSLNTAKWTEWDVPNKQTVSEETYGLSLLSATKAGHNLAGIYQAVPPSGDWAIWTKCSLSAPKVNMNIAGLMLGQDLVGAPTTSDLITLTLRIDATTHIFAPDWWNAYDSYKSTYASLTDAHIGTTCYLRIRQVSGTYGFDVSSDGMGWEQLYSGAIGFTPAQMGLILTNSNSGVTAKAMFQFFRCSLGTYSLTDVPLGRRV